MTAPENADAAKKSATDGAFLPILRSCVIPIILVVAAAACVLAVEVVVRLQVVLADLVALREAHGAGDMALRLSASIERINAARGLASRTANILGLSALFGSLALAYLGAARKIIRFSTLMFVIALLVRAYFWEVA